MLRVSLSLFSFVHLLSFYSQFSLKIWCFVEANPVAVQLCCCAEQQPVTHHSENHTKLGKNNCVWISKLSILCSQLQYSRKQGVKYISKFIVHQLLLLYMQGSSFYLSSRSYSSFSLHFLLGNSLWTTTMLQLIYCKLTFYLISFIYTHLPKRKKKGGGRWPISNSRIMQV